MMCNVTVVGRDVRNTGGDKYETTAREIQNCRFSTFCSKWRMTFRKVTPAALKVNVKKFWQVLLVPWHVWAPIWVHFAPWWSIFPVKNRFSHIFPVPGGLPFLTVILTVKLARLQKRPNFVAKKVEMSAKTKSLSPNPYWHGHFAKNGTQIGHF